jgi:hypothetical protein
MLKNISFVSHSKIERWIWAINKQMILTEMKEVRAKGIKRCCSFLRIPNFARRR